MRDIQLALDHGSGEWVATADLNSKPAYDASDQDPLKAMTKLAAVLLEQIEED